MGEFKYEQDLVPALLREQHPDLAELELRDVDRGLGQPAVAARGGHGCPVAAYEACAWVAAY